MINDMMVCLDGSAADELRFGCRRRRRVVVINDDERTIEQWSRLGAPAPGRRCLLGYFTVN
jgi:hypothetical protein